MFLCLFTSTIFCNSLGLPTQNSNFPLQVYEHNIDDDHVRGRGKRVSSGEDEDEGDEGGMEDAILMRPEDVVSSESDDDDDEFSYRPRAAISTNGKQTIRARYLGHVTGHQVPGGFTNPDHGNLGGNNLSLSRLL